MEWFTPTLSGITLIASILGWFYTHRKQEEVNQKQISANKNIEHLKHSLSMSSIFKEKKLEAIGIVWNKMQF